MVRLCLKSTLGRLALLLVATTGMLCAEEPQRLQVPLDVAGMDLPSRAEQPIRIVRDVMPGQMVHIKFRTSSEKRPDTKIALSLDFFDVDNANCRGKYADVSQSSRFIPPASRAPQVGEEVEIKRIVPPYAVTMKMALRSPIDNPMAKIETFDIDIRSPSMVELLLNPIVWWRYMPWIALTVFVFVFAVGVKRLLVQDTSLSLRIRGLSVVAIVAMFVAYAAWCLGDVFASDHDWVVPSFSVFAALLFILYSVLDGFGEETMISKRPVFCLSIMALLVHVLVIVWCNRYFHQQMTSDSSYVQKGLEAGKLYVGHASNFTYWCNYELLSSIIGIIFGTHLYVGQFINAACCVGMFYPIYDLSRSLTDKKSALFVVVLFACYPTNYFHSTLLVQEYPSAFMICWAMWLIWRALQAGIFTRRGFLYALVCGSILGMSQLLKPISPVVLIAIVVCLLASFVGDRWCSILRNGILVLVVFSSYVFVSNYGQVTLRYFSNQLQVESPKIDALTRVFAVGLDVKGRGKNTAALERRYWRTTDEERKRNTYESMRRDYVHYPVLMAEKFDRVYGSEEGLRRWFDVSIGKWRIPEFDRFVENYYFLFRILALMGAVGFALSCFARRISDQIFTVEMFMALFICGFCMMLMICEAQGRYRVPTHPLSFIMIAYLPVFVRNGIAALKHAGVPKNRRSAFAP